MLPPNLSGKPSTSVRTPTPSVATSTSPTRSTASRSDAPVDALAQSPCGHHNRCTGPALRRRCLNSWPTRVARSDRNERPRDRAVGGVRGEPGRALPPDRQVPPVASAARAMHVIFIWSARGRYVLIYGAGGARVTTLSSREGQVRVLERCLGAPSA